MGMSTEERFERVEARQDRAERWHFKWGRIWTAMWVAIAIVLPGSFAWQLHDTRHQNCVARAEARRPVIALVVLVLQQVRDPNSPLVVQLHDAIQPGQPLGPIEC